MAANNVVRIHEEIKPIKTVNDMINKFLNQKELKSENTKTSYETDIKQFFEVMLNKELQDLTNSDLSFEYDDITDYQCKLRSNLNYGNSTINRKLASIKSFYVYLSKCGVEVKPQIFDVDKLSTSDSKSYGVLSWEEAKQMVELAKNHLQGAEKSLILELAIMTSFRIDSLLELKWSDIKAKDDFYIVSTIGKGGKKDEKPIDDELYNRLCELKAKNGEGKIFSLSKPTCNRLIRSLCEEMNIDESRNISFHSLKKVAINWILQNTGDITLAQKQGAHSSPATTLKFYTEMKKDFKAMPGLAMGKEMDLSQLVELSKEELLTLISKCGNNVKLEILSTLRSSH